VYFDELAHHADMDTLSVAQSVAAATAAHSGHVTTTPAGTRHASHNSTPPEAILSPTDLSMRTRDRSTGTFTSPSSGFDSPSMHAAAGAADGTAGSGCSDSSAAAGDADRSESYVASPSPRPAVALASVTEQHVSMPTYYTR